MGNMKTSLRGRIEIMAHEGVVLRRYKDSVGVWTIGVGVTDAAGAEVRPSTYKGEITLEQAVEMFERVLRKYERRVNDAVKVPLEQHEFDALVSFDYNTGGIHRASLTRYLNSGDKASAAKGFMSWSKPKEIIGRRKKEQALFRDGKYGMGKVPLYDATPSGKIIWKSGRLVDVAPLLRPPVPTPSPAPVKPRRPAVTEVAKDAAAEDRVSTTELAAGTTVITTGIEGATRIKDAVDTASSLKEALISAGPWLLLALVGIGAGVWVWKERRRKRRAAQIALKGGA